MNYTEQEFNELIAALDPVKRCKQCPHDMGDITSRDCVFPDCYPDYYNDLNALIPLAFSYINFPENKSFNDYSMWLYYIRNGLYTIAKEKTHE